MDVKIIAGVMALTVILAAAGILIPDSTRKQDQTFPWQIEHTQASTRVFGVTLGTSTLHEAEAFLDATAEISLFADTNDTLIAEAYFDKLNLGSLSAKIITVMEVPQEQLQVMYQRGARIGTLGSGDRKVTLTAQDQEPVRQAAVASLTYIPQARLDDDLLLNRFGPPAERIQETGGATVHWLYPTLGLDIALHPKGHAVMQYIAPARFTQLRQPLSVVN